jgi:hypothetical protein
MLWCRREELCLNHNPNPHLLQTHFQKSKETQPRRMKHASPSLRLKHCQPGRYGVGCSLAVNGGGRARARARVDMYSRGVLSGGAERSRQGMGRQDRDVGGGMK